MFQKFISVGKKFGNNRRCQGSIRNVVLAVKKEARSSVENPFECLKIHGDASRISYVMQFSCTFVHTFHKHGF